MPDSTSDVSVTLGDVIDVISRGLDEPIPYRPTQSDFVLADGVEFAGARVAATRSYYLDQFGGTYADFVAFVLELSGFHLDVDDVPVLQAVFRRIDGQAPDQRYEQQRRDSAVDHEHSYPVTVSSTAG